MRDHGTEARERAHSMLAKHRYSGGECGKASGGQVAKTARRAVREHENAQHGGKHEPLKLKSGGAVDGEPSESRPDRRARGGEHKSGGKGKIGAVNIMVGHTGAEEQQAKQEGMQAGMQQGVQVGARVAAQKMGGGAGGPPRPPMAGPPPGGMPPGMPPGAPPPGAMPPRPMPPQMAKGGEVRVREHHRRRAGGAV
jgi:hypothetical protein